MTGRSTAAAITAALTAVLLVLAGCSSHDASQDSAKTASVPLDPGTAARLRLGSGVEVDVPKGAVQGKGTLRGRTTTSPGSPGEALRTGTVYDLHVSGT